LTAEGILNILAVPLVFAFLAALVAAVHAARRGDSRRALVVYPRACIYAGIVIITMCAADLSGLFGA
jgi:hypothetical protein